MQAGSDHQIEAHAPDIETPDTDSTASHLTIALAVGAVALTASGAAQAAVTIGPTTRVLSAHDGWRFLTQATFGPRPSDLDSSTLSSTATAKKLWASGYSAWLDEQFALPRGRSTYDMLLDKNGSWPNPWGRPDGNGKYQLGRNYNMWKDAAMLTDVLWEQFLSANDQLRHRVAFALSEIFVVSLQNTLLEWTPKVAAFHDLLLDNAFGSFRTLIEGVCRSPAMGFYLTHFRNEKPEFDSADQETRIPDQNFARELMQLFTIGLVQLNPDGSPKLDASGQPQPTYTPSDIKVLSYVFTGWAYASNGIDGDKGMLDFDRRIDRGFHSADRIRTVVDPSMVTDPNDTLCLLDVYQAAGGSSVDLATRQAAAERIVWGYMRKPMTAYDRLNPVYQQLQSIQLSDATRFAKNIDMFSPRHAEESDYQKGLKLPAGTQPTFLGKPLAVNGTCEGDMKNALDILLAHPNVAPFIAKQLIQRLVTSNPSPAYVGRAAKAFKDSGLNLKALVRAVLLDTEARDVATNSTNDTYGKLREPILRTTAVLRAIKHVPSKHLGTSLPLYAMNPTHPVSDGVDEANFLTCLGQGAFCAPSVFNFFRPGYQQPGSNMASRGKVAPEFQIASGVETTAWINTMLNMFYTLGFGRTLHKGTQAFANRTVDYSATGITKEQWLMHIQPGISLDLRDEMKQVTTSLGRSTFVSNINNRLFGGKMSTSLKNKLNEVLALSQPLVPDGPATAADWSLNKVVLCYFLSVISADFVVQK